jgi:hypothetical protein
MNIQERTDKLASAYENLILYAMERYPNNDYLIQQHIYAILGRQSQLGSGAHARVYKGSGINSDLVIKVRKAMDTYGVFINFVLDYPEYQEFTPKIYSHVSVGNFTITIMERLYSAAAVDRIPNVERLKASLVEWVDDCTAQRNRDFEAYASWDEDMRNFAASPEGDRFDQFCRDLNKYSRNNGGGYWDLHYGNMMYRRTPDTVQWVLTDPLN